MTSDAWLRQIWAYKQAGNPGAAWALLRRFLQEIPNREAPEDLPDQPHP